MVFEMKSKIFLMITLILLWSCNDNSTNPIDENLDFPEVIQFTKAKLTASVNETPSGKYPIRTMGIGKWEFTNPNEWTSGFFPGALWYSYMLTNDEQINAHADYFTIGLKGQEFHTDNHDVGFMIFSSFGNGYKVNQSEEYKNIILQGANSLASRYNPTVGSIQSWNGEFQVIIDNMMNLEILFWAAKNGGSQSLYDIAVSHANNSIKDHIREDGSSYHVVVYDPVTGEVDYKRAAQGYDVNSCWSRGQAWGIYGFTMCYRETNDEKYLAAAKKMADYFIENLPFDYIPYWDFKLPENYDKNFRDASAASIACSALFELGKILGKESKYYSTGVNILISLNNNYLSINTASSGLLLHGAYNVNSSNPNDWDASTIWGDYYYMEALWRYKNL